MRHGKKFNHLGRTSEHRKALLKNLSIALIDHKRIKTTLAKAKALRKHIEPIVTRAKSNTMHNRRVAFSYLQDKEAVKTLFGEIGPKVADRPGGYVRVIKLGFRRSDGAEMGLIEFVDFNDIYSNDKSAAETTGKKKRSRRGSSKKKAVETTIEEATESTEETSDDV